jgi:hypothetical protein
MVLPEATGLGRHRGGVQGGQAGQEANNALERTGHPLARLPGRSPPALGTKHYNHKR